jgi:hypothetical protein
VCDKSSIQEPFFTRSTQHHPQCQADLTLKLVPALSLEDAETAVLDLDFQSAKALTKAEDPSPKAEDVGKDNKRPG